MKKAREPRDKRDITALMESLDNAFKAKNTNELFKLFVSEAGNLDKFKTDFKDLEKDPVEIRDCRHSINKIELDEAAAVLECEITLVIHDPESMTTRELKPAPRKIELRKKSDKWLISNYKTVK